MSTHEIESDESDIIKVTKSHGRKCGNKSVSHFQFAVSYISEHGLCFNPIKTNCLIKGNHPFNNDAKWYINGTKLKTEQHINYLGAVISNNSGKEYVSSRLNSCRKPYSLQGAGLSHNSLDIDTLMYI